MDKSQSLDEYPTGPVPGGTAEEQVRKSLVHFTRAAELQGYAKSEQGSVPNSNNISGANSNDANASGPNASNDASALVDANGSVPSGALASNKRSSLIAAPDKRTKKKRTINLEGVSEFLADMHVLASRHCYHARCFLLCAGLQSGLFLAYLIAADRTFSFSMHIGTWWFALLNLLITLSVAVLWPFMFRRFRFLGIIFCVYATVVAAFFVGAELDLGIRLWFFYFPVISYWCHYVVCYHRSIYRKTWLRVLRIEFARGGKYDKVVSMVDAFAIDDVGGDTDDDVDTSGAVGAMNDESGDRATIGPGGQESDQMQSVVSFPSTQNSSLGNLGVVTRGANIGASNVIIESNSSANTSANISLDGQFIARPQQLERFISAASKVSGHFSVNQSMTNAMNIASLNPEAIARISSASNPSFTSPGPDRLLSPLVEPRAVGASGAPGSNLEEIAKGKSEDEVVYGDEGTDMEKAARVSAELYGGSIIVSEISHEDYEDQRELLEFEEELRTLQDQREDKLPLHLQLGAWRDPDLLSQMGANHIMRPFSPLRLFILLAGFVTALNMMYFNDISLHKVSLLSKYLRSDVYADFRTDFMTSVRPSFKTNAPNHDRYLDLMVIDSLAACGAEVHTVNCGIGFWGTLLLLLPFTINQSRLVCWIVMYVVIPAITLSYVLPFLYFVYWASAMSMYGADGMMNENFYYEWMMDSLLRISPEVVKYTLRQVDRRLIECRDVMETPLSGRYATDPDWKGHLRDPSTGELIAENQANFVCEQCVQANILLSTFLRYSSYRNLQDGYLDFKLSTAVNMLVLPKELTKKPQFMSHTTSSALANWSGRDVHHVTNLISPSEEDSPSTSANWKIAKGLPYNDLENSLKKGIALQEYYLQQHRDAFGVYESNGGEGRASKNAAQVRRSSEDIGTAESETAVLALADLAPEATDEEPRFASSTRKRISASFVSATSSTSSARSFADGLESVNTQNSLQNSVIENNSVENAFVATFGPKFGKRSSLIKPWSFVTKKATLPPNPVAKPKSETRIHRTSGLNVNRQELRRSLDAEHKENANREHLITNWDDLLPHCYPFLISWVFGQHISLTENRIRFRDYYEDDDALLRPSTPTDPKANNAYHFEWHHTIQRIIFMTLLWGTAWNCYSLVKDIESAMEVQAEAARNLAAAENIEIVDAFADEGEDEEEGGDGVPSSSGDALVKTTRTKKKVPEVGLPEFYFAFLCNKYDPRSMQDPNFLGQEVELDRLLKQIHTIKLADIQSLEPGGHGDANKSKKLLGGTPGAASPNKSLAGTEGTSTYGSVGVSMRGSVQQEHSFFRSRHLGDWVLKFASSKRASRNLAENNSMLNLVWYQEGQTQKDAPDDANGMNFDTFLYNAPGFLVCPLPKISNYALYTRLATAKKDKMPPKEVKGIELLDWKVRMGLNPISAATHRLNRDVLAYFGSALKTINDQCIISKKFQELVKTQIIDKFGSLELVIFRSSMFGAKLAKRTEEEFITDLKSAMEWRRDNLENVLSRFDELPSSEAPKPIPNRVAAHFTMVDPNKAAAGGGGGWFSRGGADTSHQVVEAPPHHCTADMYRDIVGIRRFLPIFGLVPFTPGPFLADDGLPIEFVGSAVEPQKILDSFSAEEIGTMLVFALEYRIRVVSLLKVTSCYMIVDASTLAFTTVMSQMKLYKRLGEIADPIIMQHGFFVPPIKIIVIGAPGWLVSMIKVLPASPPEGWINFVTDKSAREVFATLCTDPDLLPKFDKAVEDCMLKKPLYTVPPPTSPNSPAAMARGSPIQ